MTVKGRFKCIVLSKLVLVVRLLESQCLGISFVNVKFKYIFYIYENYQSSSLKYLELGRIWLELWREVLSGGFSEEVRLTK